MSGRAKKPIRFGQVLSLALVGTLWMAAACGSGSSSSSSAASSSGMSSAPAGTGGPGGNTIADPAPNVAALTVNTGPNFLFTTVTVCAPGTSTCATIPNVLVDTGSYGLRVLASSQGASGTAVTSLGLPQVRAANNLPLLECVTFLDNSFVWGPVQRADVIIAGETAGNIPIQIIGAPQFLQDVPNDCGGGIAANNENSFDTLGANGILGIGLFIEDCGTGCAPPNPPPGSYYACSAGGAGSCEGSQNGSQNNATSVPVVNQVSNPVAFFAQDNNGTIIQLPAVPAGGATSVSGSMVFGIGTQANNGLGNATVLTAVTAEAGSSSSHPGSFTTQFGGQAFPGSFIDSGSNGFYFLDSAAINGFLGGNPLPACPQSGAFSNDASITSFYCGTLSSSATNVGTNGNSTIIHIGVANAETQFLTNNQNNEAFNNVAGLSSVSFDWGMPFFFGRNVYTAIEGVTPPSGVPAGPFWAY
jgi:hypothetical protein